MNVPPFQVFRTTGCIFNSFKYVWDSLALAKSKFWGGMWGLFRFCVFVLRALLCFPPLPLPKVDFTYPSLEEPAPVPPVVAIKPSPTEVIENEETRDNLEERLKSLNRPNAQDAAVPKSDSSIVVNPVSITRSIPEVSYVSFFSRVSIWLIY